MAGIQITGSSQFASQAIRAGLILDYENQFRFMALLGAADDDRAIIPVLESPSAERGTNMKVRFQATQKAPMPLGYGTNPLGLGATPTWREYDFDINYLVLAVGGQENTVFDQNVVEFSIEQADQVNMARKAARIMEWSLAHQLAGYTPVNAAAYTDGATNYILSCCNPTTEPDASHHFFCPDNSGDNTTEAQVAADSSATLTSRFVDKVLAQVTSHWHVENPLGLPRTPWGEGYVLLCSKEGMRQVKENTADSDIFELAKACIQGGMDPANSTLWTGEGFKVGQVFYLESDFMPLGCSGATPGAETAGTAISNVQRAVLLGARAAHVRYGMGFTDGMHLGYAEHPVLRTNNKIIDTVMGGAATIVNSQRWGSVVISHYTNATTTGAAYL